MPSLKPLIVLARSRPTPGSLPVPNSRRATRRIRIQCQVLVRPIANLPRGGAARAGAGGGAEGRDDRMRRRRVPATGVAERRTAPRGAGWRSGVPPAVVLALAVVVA